MNEVLGLSCKGESSKGFLPSKEKRLAGAEWGAGGGRSEKVATKGGYGESPVWKFKLCYIVLYSLWHTFGRCVF